MNPFQLFESVWERCAQLDVLHAYLEKNVSAVLHPEELLRAEWAARVSALDLFIHEIVAQRMLEIFEGSRKTTPAYLKFRVSNDTMDRIRAARSPSDASAAFDLDVREQLGRMTFQDPDDIADGIRLVSDVELWNAVALHTGASAITKVANAKKLKKDLSLVVRRRHKIVHEGDLQAIPPREPWPIAKLDLAIVSNLIEKIVVAINAVA